jgi:uncharacterized membrane protein
MYCNVKQLSTDVSEVRTASIIRDPPVDNYFTRQYIPENNSELQVRDTLLLAVKKIVLLKVTQAIPVRLSDKIE